jgi:predicted esterase
VLVGFHGYAESADIALERLRQIPESRGWLLVAVQGLHRFYRSRSTDVVAGWMTAQDRELMIADNLAYVAAVVAAVSREETVDARLVLAGFSQGVAMAFRAAAGLPRPVSGVIVVGGDVPPELDARALARIPVALVGRGVRDSLYPPEKFASDQERLSAAGVDVHPVELDAAHEWNAEFSLAAGAFLSRV